VPADARPDRPSPCPVLLALVALVALTAACGGDPSAEPLEVADGGEGITVAAASDLRPAFEELGAAFTAGTGTPVTFTFGSSGQLHQQIVNGAPYDLFASADLALVEEIVEAGRGRADTVAEYAVGRLAIAVPDGDPLPLGLADLAGAAYRRIAIANPAHAPYGVAAEEALESVGILPSVADRLVLGENVSDAFQIVRSSNADAAIIALSLVLAERREHVLVPDDLHEPIRQALVVTGTGARGRAAEAFAALVASPAGRQLMVHAGFALPDEDLPGDP
jgi:molybdate transport system substrate-binding protein